MFRKKKTVNILRNYLHSWNLSELCSSSYNNLPSGNKRKIAALITTQRREKTHVLEQCLDLIKYVVKVV